MKLPWSDGTGWKPDSTGELVADALLIFLIVMTFSFFTGLDAQVSYIVNTPGQYFSSTSENSEIVLTNSQISDVNFAAKNRIGFTSPGDEIGLCGGVRDSGEVFNLRVADGFEETSRDSVTFECSKPRELIMHSQPGYNSGLSAEDKSFDGEFKPQYSCIVFGELAVSPVSGEVGNLNCWKVSEGSFEQVSVLPG